MLNFKNWAINPLNFVINCNISMDNLKKRLVIMIDWRCMCRSGETVDYLLLHCETSALRNTIFMIFLIFFLFLVRCISCFTSFALGVASLRFLIKFCLLMKNYLINCNVSPLLMFSQYMLFLTFTSTHLWSDYKKIKEKNKEIISLSIHNLLARISKWRGSSYFFFFSSSFFLFVFFF